MLSDGPPDADEALIKTFVDDGSSSGLAPVNVGDGRRTADPARQVFLKSMEVERLALYCGLVVIDVLALTVAFATAGFIRFGNFELGVETDLLKIVLPVFVASAAFTRAYS